MYPVPEIGRIGARTIRWRSWRLVFLVTMCAAAGLSVVACAESNGSIAVPIRGESVQINRPDPGRPVVISVRAPSENGELTDLGYIVDDLRGRGVGVLELSGDMQHSDTDVQIREAVGGLRRLQETADVPIGILVSGHGGASIWSLLADPPVGVISAVLVNVPGRDGVDFSKGQSVAVLSLNVKADAIATESHAGVHASMAQALITHQVIVYGGVSADALSGGSSGWDAATANDAAQRAVEWLVTRDGVSNVGPASADTGMHH